MRSSFAWPFAQPANTASAIALTPRSAIARSNLPSSVLRIDRRWPIPAERILILLGHIQCGFMDIDPRRLRRGVAKDSLHGGLANPAAHHLGCQPMPERMRGHL